MTSPTASTKELDLRLRLATDFEFYASNFIYIRGDEGSERFKLNKVQRDLMRVIDGQMAATGKIRIVILKARQQGLSTFVSAYLYWKLSHQGSKKGLVVAHIAKSTQSLFDMYRRAHSSMEPRLKPSTSYAGRTELFFDKLDTGLAVATAGGDGIARGETFTHAHLSEVAFWPKGAAYENFNALMQSIPNNPGTVVFIESTANGVSGVFHDAWQGAVAGKNGFVPFFSPWYDSPKYFIKGGTITPGEETVEELELRAFGVKDDQLAWRRQKIAQNGRDAFMQEYPANAQEAFLNSGAPIFPPILLTDMLSKAPPVLRTETLSFDNKWEELSSGELRLFEEIDPTGTYVIGADVALGSGKDYSVAQILDENKNQVAIWRGKCDPNRFAEVLESLGYRFNTARIICENNTFGFATVSKLGQDMHYPAMFFTIKEGKLDGDETKAWGFRTSQQSKPMVIARLQEVIRTGDIQINDTTTLDELLTFITTEGGRMEAESGCHDDTVMALALANYAHMGKFKPIEVSDEYYTRAI
jgi:hypothetical protein